MLAGGNLQLLLLSSKKEKWWRVMVTTGSTQMFQIILISLLTSAYYGGNLFRDARNDSLPRNNENTTGTNGTKPQGTPKTTRSFVFTPLGVILYVILWIGGLVSIMVGLLMVVFHLVYLFFPCIMMYLLIWGETRDWKDWDPSKPCPQLWKDGLEDELWWF
jgi:phage shock protein PspC (stress-responsive transcriptional regulator)